MANIEGNSVSIARVETGFWSMDRALGNSESLGAPMTVYEIFGFQGVYKTTYSTYMAGLLAQHFGKNVVYAPIEHVDIDYMGHILDSAGFTGVTSVLGNWDMVKKFLPHYKKSKDDFISDEMIVDCIVSAMRLPEYGAMVLDSLTTMMAISEMESSSADANMGRRGRLVSLLSKALVHADRFRDGEPYASFLISHKFKDMGGGTPSNTGTMTAGGEMKKNVSKIRIGIRRIKDVSAFYEDSSGNPYDDNAYVLEGKVEKNNFGREGKTFFVAGLGGQGLHRGLTAMYECKKIGIATFGRSITLGSEKFGTIRDAVLKAHAGEDDFFQPFIDALQNPSKVGKAESDEEEWYEEEPAD